jgi:hypothetical protein
MNTPAAARPTAPARSSLLARLRVPAILFLISINMLWFGGNALADIAQALGPATHFTGTITGHDKEITTGENSQQILRLTIDSTAGPIIYDLGESDHTFDDTQVGQHVFGTQDRWGFPLHDPALRSLSADGKSVLATSARNRVVGQSLILGVVLFVCSVALRWVWSRSRRTRDAPPDSYAVPVDRVQTSDG